MPTFTLLATGPITTPNSTTSTTPDALGLDAARGVLLQSNFQGGTGGTSVSAYVQSTADGGLTWYDVANFTFANTAGIKQCNLRAQTPVTTPVAPTDGTLAANTSIDGIIGDQLRVKWSSTGTYTSNTSLTITAVAR